MNYAFWDHDLDIWHLGERFPGFFASLLMIIVQFLCLAVYFIESVFWALTRGIEVSNGKYVSIVDYLIGFGTNGEMNKNNPITNFVVFFIVIGFALIVLMAVISIIKSHLSTKDEDKNPTTVLVGVLKAVLLMVCFPLITFCILKVVNGLTDSVCEYAGIKTGSAIDSIANKLFYMFANSKAADTSEWYKNGKPAFSFLLNEGPFNSGMNGETLWKKMVEINFVTNEIGGYSYLFAIIVLIILAYGLFKACLLMGKRIFDIAVLYVVAPISISCYPNDDGKRYELWKDQIIAKTLSSFGLTLAFIIFILFTQSLYDWFGTFEGFKTLDLTTEGGKFNEGTILTVVFLVVTISGALGVPNIYSMLATLVSSTAGQTAGQDMQNMSQDMAFFQRGAHAIGGAALGAGMFALKSKPVQALLGGSKALKKNKPAFAGAGAGMQNAGDVGSKLAASNEALRSLQGQSGVGGYIKNNGILGLLPSNLLKSGIGAGARKLSSMSQDRKEKKLTGLINDAVNSYNNKDQNKLASLNKQIGKMTHGQTKIDDKYIANRTAERERTNELLKKQSEHKLTDLTSRKDNKKAEKQHIKDYKTTLKREKKGDNK